ncbi:hypothetical protein F5148DRAFT_570932 [Russula earlei]|uniref:Uncharacterized protein n=1 Tax=Russula earlei TaxID=71964 RepID=A0ACC0UG45_9AGAM|nr:hypothetical protein F5148DRAFT_570932 [Russula earlei]
MCVCGSPRRSHTHRTRDRPQAAHASIHPSIHPSIHQSAAHSLSRRHFSNHRTLRLGSARLGRNDCGVASPAQIEAKARDRAESHSAAFLSPPPFRPRRDHASGRETGADGRASEAPTRLAGLSKAASTAGMISRTASDTSTIRPPSRWWGTVRMIGTGACAAKRRRKKPTRAEWVAPWVERRWSYVRTRCVACASCVGCVIRTYGCQAASSPADDHWGRGLDLHDVVLSSFPNAEAVHLRDDEQRSTDGSGGAYGTVSCCRRLS